jgi:RNA polymerase sigma factor (sigma-70 family)
VAGVDGKDKDRKEAVQAATAVFTEYGAFIRAVIRFQAAGKFDPEDLFQEFFLALVHKPMPLEVRNIKSFLYRAVINYVVDVARRQAGHERKIKKYTEQSRISINNRAARNAFIVEQENEDTAVAYMVRHLQVREAQAFILKYRDNCSIAEIAATMGVNKRTVSRYLSEGLKKLRKTIAIE